MEATIQDNIGAWRTAFAEYLAWTSKQPQEALEKKVKSLGVALYEGFSAHKLGKGVARSQLEARTADHKGTLVRPSLFARYELQAETLRSDAKALRKQKRGFGGTLDNWVTLVGQMAANAKERINLWQRTVGEEISLRASGAQELGAAFLWSRYRGKGEARHLVNNRAGKQIGSVDVGPGSALITASISNQTETPGEGLAVLDAKYHIVADAIGAETEDMLNWIKDQQDKAGERLSRAVFA